MPQRKKQSNKNAAPQWRRMDLHLHTPASADYRETGVTYLDILKKAEQKGLDIIAITDHNTAAGFRRYQDEIDDLELLERRKRLTDEEKAQLAEFRRLREKILVLPSFELTCTLGFHVLGIFPPETTVRELEHLLLNLHVPPEKLDVGSGEVGATSDVLTAYRLINEAGGLAIAAHANSSHGVAMPGFDFGGQTRIAYTQDENLHALEVTDLTSKSRRRTQMFFSGTKPEYPRKMHCIQGSDAHRLNGIPSNNQELGVGDRPTEILLPELTFDAILDIFLGRDFSKTRPYIPAALHEFDPLYAAREEGDSLVQAFHESVGKHGVDRRILQDVVALANTNGGTIYIGASANIRQPIQGVQKPLETANHLRNEINKHIVPPLDAQIDTLKTAGKIILQMIVPRGSDVPYALDSTQIFVRSENETSLAVRDEIVNLVRDAVAVEFAARVENAPLEAVAAVESVEAFAQAQEKIESAAPKLANPLPRTGVEIVASKTRAKGDLQYTMRDLRNNRIIHNVTRSSARKLWQYAIGEYDNKTAEKADIHWLGQVGVLKASERAGKVRYDLAQRDSTGALHVYYGVTDDGIHGIWKDLVESITTPLAIEPDEDETVSASGITADELGAAAADLATTHAAADAVTETDFATTRTATDAVTKTDFATTRAATDAVTDSAPDEMLLSAAEATTDAAPFPITPPLLTTPGRSLFPPPGYDLTPSTSETDDVSIARDEPTLTTLDARIESTAPPPFTFAETNSPEPAAAVEIAVETAPEIISESPHLDASNVALPFALEIPDAPTTYAVFTPVEIVSGQALAPIVEIPNNAADLIPPTIDVNLPDQFIITRADESANSETEQ